MKRTPHTEASRSADPHAFDGNQGVQRHYARERRATQSGSEIDRILREGRATIVAQQALRGANERQVVDTSDDDGSEGSIFDELGHHLSPDSNLSTRAKIELMQGMLHQQQAVDTFTPTAMTNHAVHEQKGAPIHSPAPRRLFPRKYGPIRKPNP